MSSQIVGRIFHETAAVDPAIAIRNYKDAGNGILDLEVILQDADEENRNGRIYPKSVIEPALQSDFIKEKLATRSLAGEMNHPDAKLGMARQMRIDMSNICHFIHEFFWEKNLLIGKLQTAGNRLGKDLAGMISGNGMIPSFSMRGAGDVMRQGSRVIVKPGLNIRTWDCVHFPSHKSAYARQLSESTEIIITKDELSAYIASSSENAKVLVEEVSMFAEHLTFDVENGILRIKDNMDNLLAESLIEKNLRQEYEDVMLSAIK